LYFYPEQGRRHGVIEATFIAAALTLTVDPFVKKRLATEINKDIFYHVIGFQLPEPMQDSLRKYLRGLKYYRELLSIKVSAKEIIGDDVTIEVELTGRSVMLTKYHYHQSLLFEEAEHGQVLEMWAKRPGSQNNLVEWKNSPPITSDSEPMTQFYKGPDVKLQRGDKLESYVKFTLRGRKIDYWVQTFGTTTLKTEITLVPLENMKMFVSQPERATSPTATHFDYDDVFIIGEDLKIRWQVADS
jgi:hypothetical protein